MSARGNALALRSNLSAGEILQRLNTVAPELFFSAVAPISEEFRVRAATRRTYVYFDPLHPADAGRTGAAAHLFHGRIDVRSLGREIRADAPHWRSVESVAVRPLGHGRLIEVRAPSFVWGMVRKIVGSLREIDAGRLTLARLEAALAGRERLTLPMAEPEGLVLWDVEYPIVWRTVWVGPNRHQVARARATTDDLWRRVEVARALVTGLVTDPP